MAQASAGPINEKISQKHLVKKNDLKLIRDYKFSDGNLYLELAFKPNNANTYCPYDPKWVALCDIKKQTLTSRKFAQCIKMLVFDNITKRNERQGRKAKRIYQLITTPKCRLGANCGLWYAFQEWERQNAEANMNQSAIPNLYNVLMDEWMEILPNHPETYLE